MTKPMNEQELRKKARLIPEEIGDNLDIEVEGSYPCSDGSITMTISVDALIDAQLDKAIPLISQYAREQVEPDDVTNLIEGSGVIISHRIYHISGSQLNQIIQRWKEAGIQKAREQRLDRPELTREAVEPILTKHFNKATGVLDFMAFAKDIVALLSDEKEIRDQLLSEEGVKASIDSIIKREREQILKEIEKLFEANPNWSIAEEAQRIVEGIFHIRQSLQQGSNQQ